MSKAEARGELRQYHFWHKTETANFERYWARFLTEVGDRAEYRSSDIAAWLGY